MQESAEVRDAMVRFFDRLSAGDVASFDDVVAQHPGVVVIGTAPGEWVRDRDRLRDGFEAEGARVEPADPVGYREGNLGWGVDEPTFFFPGDVSVNARVTGILLREEDRWRLVHMHVSVGVPDDDVMDLQRKWGR